MVAQRLLLRHFAKRLPAAARGLGRLSAGPPAPARPLSAGGVVLRQDVRQPLGAGMDQRLGMVAALDVRLARAPPNRPLPVPNSLAAAAGAHPQALLRTHQPWRHRPLRRRPLVAPAQQPLWASGRRMAVAEPHGG